jgi:hypothetical protein
MCSTCSTNGEKRNLYSILEGKPEGKRPLGRPRRRWVNNVKMYIREIGRDGMIWIGLIWLRIGTSGGLLWTRYWTFGFHKMLESTWVAAQLAASQEGLSPTSERAESVRNVRSQAYIASDWLQICYLVVLIFLYYNAKCSMRGCQLI